MFSRDRKSASAEAPATPAPAKRPEARGGVPSIISADLKIVGDLRSNGDLQIDGVIEGNVSSRGVTVGEEAVVRGTLAGDSVHIYGTVEGDIRAKRVMLAPTARIMGDIAHETISMEAGASLTGQLRRLEVSADAGAGDAPAARPGAASVPGEGERRTAS